MAEQEHEIGMVVTGRLILALIVALIFLSTIALAAG
jgi:hypothetical protein